MSDRNPIGFLDIRLVEEKLIDETILQDYRKVHEKLERLLDKVAKPLDGETVSSIEEQFLAWLHVHEGKKDEGGRLTSLLRCGLGHLAVAIASSRGDGLLPHEVVDNAVGEFRQRGWNDRVFDAIAAESAAKKYAVIEKKITPARPAAKKNPKAAGIAGARQRIQKEGSAMSDVMNAGVVPAPAESPVAAKPKAVRKPRAAAPKAPAKKAAAPKKAAAKKPAAKKPVAKKAAAKKPVAKKAVAKKPVAKKAAAKKPVAKKATTLKAKTVKKAAAKKPVAKKAAAKKPVAKKAAAKKPVAKKAAAKKPAAKKPAAKVAKKAAKK